MRRWHVRWHRQFRRDGYLRDRLNGQRRLSDNCTGEPLSGYEGIVRLRVDVMGEEMEVSCMYEQVSVLVDWASRVTDMHTKMPMPEAVCAGWGSSYRWSSRAYDYSCYMDRHRDEKKAEWTPSK